jgi:hypothetical protein
MAANGSILTISLNTDDTGAALANRILVTANSTSFSDAVQRATALINLLARCVAGGLAGRLYTVVDGVTGTGSGNLGTLNITIATNPADTETITILGNSMAFATAAANENQVTLGTTDILTATALAAAINAHTVYKGWVTATQVGATNVVAVTARCSGAWQRFVNFATGTAAGKVSFSASRLTPANETLSNTERGTSWNLGRPAT